MRKPSVPSYKEAIELARDINRSILATDPRFSRYVFAAHQDGTLFFLSHSFASYFGRYLLVICEHQSPLVFDLDDLSAYGQFQMRQSFGKRSWKGGPKAIARVPYEKRTR